MDPFELLAENPFTGAMIVASADPAKMPEHLRTVVIADRELGHAALMNAVITVIEVSVATGTPLADVAEAVCLRADGSEPFMTMSVVEA